MVRFCFQLCWMTDRFRFPKDVEHQRMAAPHTVPVGGMATSSAGFTIKNWGVYWVNVSWVVRYFIFLQYYTSIWGQVKIGGPEQAPGPHPFHTPVPYPRSIPPWRIRSIPLFHTSDIYNYIYIYLIMCNLISHLYAHIWAHVHTWVHTCKNTSTMPKPCDCVGKSVPAALTAATYFVVWW